MAKFETIICATTWGLMNALMLAIAFDAVAPTQGMNPAPAVQVARVSTATTA